MKKRKYKNPPLVEALCEFQFIPNQPWDVTIPGLLYEKIKDTFPDRQQKIGLGVQLKVTEKELEHRVEPIPPLIQFHKKDKTALIQVAPDLLVVNHLQPYPEWEIFKSMILENLQKYIEVANPKGFKRIGLRYINVFEFAKPEIELEDYFKYRPYIHEKLPKTLSTFITKTEFPLEDGNEILIMTLALQVPSKPNVLAILLDIDYAMIKTEYVMLDNVQNWLEKAHNKAEEAFEESITEKARILFRGKAKC